MQVSRRRIWPQPPKFFCKALQGKHDRLPVADWGDIYQHHQGSRWPFGGSMVIMSQQNGKAP